MQTTQPSPGIGSPAPEFELADASGKPITAQALRGHPVILAFFPQRWDPSRSQQLAHFNDLVAQVPGVNADLLGITSDGVWCNLAFHDEDVSVPVLTDLDPRGDIAEQFGVSGEQAVVVIDARGIIRWRHTGPIDATNTSALLATLAALAPDPDAPRRLSDVPRESTARLTPSRRDFIATALAAAVVLSAAPLEAKAERIAKATAAKLPAPVPITLNVNGRVIALNVEPRVTLLDALREYAALTGTKKGCDHGQCGACTVHIDGRRELSCMTFAVMQQRAKITTVEGLATGDTLHSMQAAFIKHDGFQCGYCTPGQLMSATALLKEPCGNADADVRECMSGNICRCGAYPGIVAAIQDVRGNARS
jgi:xanthine dehydrogenase YagT iron-sulfur-binding subunit